MIELSDAEIVAECKNGNQLAFNELVRRYQEKIYWLIRRMVSDHDDANDISQDVFVKVFHSIKDFRGESSLFTWLYRIATNMSLNFIRRRKLRSFFSIDTVEHMIESDEERPLDLMEKKEQRTLIERAIETLPEKQKAVFILRYYEEMPYEEMATLLKKSTGGLKANYFHAVRKIEEYLKHAL